MALVVGREERVGERLRREVREIGEIEASREPVAQEREEIALGERILPDPHLAPALPDDARHGGRREVRAGDGAQLDVADPHELNAVRLEGHAPDRADDGSSCRADDGGPDRTDDGSALGVRPPISSWIAAQHSATLRGSPTNNRRLRSIGANISASRARSSRTAVTLARCRASLTIDCAVGEET